MPITDSKKPKAASQCKKLFKFLKNIFLQKLIVSPFFMFNNACFFLFCGYIARYAPFKNK